MELRTKEGRDIAVRDIKVRQTDLEINRRDVSPTQNPAWRRAYGKTGQQGGLREEGRKLPSEDEMQEAVSHMSSRQRNAWNSFPKEKQNRIIAAAEENTIRRMRYELSVLPSGNLPRVSRRTLSDKAVNQMQNPAFADCRMYGIRYVKAGRIIPDNADSRGG